MKFCLCLLTLFVWCTANAQAQYCVGHTKYEPRDEKGRLMKKKHLKMLKVLSVDGKKRKLVPRKEYFGIFYKNSNGNRSHGLYFRKRLSFMFGYCNQIRDLLLEFRGKKMLLIFDMGILNSNFDIQALKFSRGTFRLNSVKCTDGKSPPRIDNENQGVCKVSAASWEKVSDKIEEMPDECCKPPKFGHP